MFNYQEISNDITSGLPDRTRSIISRRFGLDKRSSQKVKKESLESIGNSYGITRERVRQIEKDGIDKVKANLGKYKTIFSRFKEKIVGFGGVKREDLYISSLCDKGAANHAFFLLEISDLFSKFSGSTDFHSFWALDKNHINSTKVGVDSIKSTLNKEKVPLKIDYFYNTLPSISTEKVNSYLEISKHIHLNSDGFFGFNHWSEVNPRSIKDKIHLVMKKNGKPLHFSEVAKMIEGSLVQTVHNELIKDPRFILVGRGIYALKEWGYSSGEIKQVIKDILTKSKKPISKDEIIEKVLQKRVVKKSTIIQNLCNKKNFIRTPNGGYVVNT